MREPLSGPFGVGMVWVKDGNAEGEYLQRKIRLCKLLQKPHKGTTEDMRR